MASYKNIRAAVGEYTDKQGNKKTQWANIGKLFFREDGRISMVIDLIPVNWSGSAIAVDPLPENGAQAGTGTGGSRPTPAVNVSDELPF